MQYLKLVAFCPSCHIKFSGCAYEGKLSCTCSKCGQTIAFAELVEFTGYIYILFSPLIPHQFKIGFSQNHPSLRAQEISSGTGVPIQFRVLGYAGSSSPFSHESSIHQELGEYRTSSNREFFSTQPLAIISCIERVTGAPFKFTEFQKTPNLDLDTIWPPRANSVSPHPTQEPSNQATQFKPRKAPKRGDTFMCLECGKKMSKPFREFHKKKHAFRVCEPCSFFVSAEGFEIPQIP